MHTLADVQAAIRNALVAGNTAAALTVIRGGAHPEHRLAIHQRHYAASLTRALLDRFPATVWLVGSDFVTQAAQSYIHDFPPVRPCIAEYGEHFPRYIGARPGGEALPYLQQFAALEWCLGRLALATDTSPNLACVHLDWSVDELIAIYLSDTAPDQFELRREDVWLEVHGRRGELTMTRLSEQEFVRRAAAAREDTVDAV